jgi:hypothetical protein
MPHLIRIRLYLTFFKSFVFTTSLLTCCSLYVLSINGIRAFAPAFWFKIVTLFIVFYFINGSKKKEFYYYRNLGLSRFSLFSAAFFSDVFIYALALILTHNWWYA